MASGTHTRWLIWFGALGLFVLNCFWIIDQAYSYRKSVAELYQLQKVLHRTKSIHTQRHIYSQYQQSLYNIEQSARQQGLSKPSKVRSYIIKSQEYSQHSTR